MKIEKVLYKAQAKPAPHISTPPPRSKSSATHSAFQVSVSPILDNAPNNDGPVPADGNAPLPTRGSGW
jgi:hypothetical protein